MNDPEVVHHVGVRSIAPSGMRRLPLYLVIRRLQRGIAFQHVPRRFDYTLRASENTSSSQIPRRPDSCRSNKVDESACNVQAAEFHPDRIADFDSCSFTSQLSLNGRLEHAHPRSLVAGSGDDRIERLADPPRQELRRCRLSHLTLDFAGSIFLICAMC